jgi:hypothetical protein
MALAMATGLFASHVIAHTDAGFFDSAKAKFGQVANSLAAGAENRRNSAELCRIQARNRNLKTPTRADAGRTSALKNRAYNNNVWNNRGWFGYQK